MTTINNLVRSYQSNYNVNNANVHDSLSFSENSHKTSLDTKIKFFTDGELKIIEENLALKDLKINYVKDKETGENIIQIKDDKNNIVRQLPPKEQLAIRKAIDDFFKQYDAKGKVANITNALLSTQS